MNSKVELNTVGTVDSNKRVLVWRVLIVALLILCVVIGYSFYLVIQFHRHVATFQKQAAFLTVPYIDDQGGLWEYAYGSAPQSKFIPAPLLRYHRSLYSIEISHRADSDPEEIDDLFDLLPYFSQLNGLGLEGMLIDQQRALQISRLNNMKTIRLKNCRFEKSCLAILLKQEGLTYVDLSDSTFEEAELNVLNEGKAKKTLLQLNLSNCKITDAGAAIISRLRNLEILMLDGTQITDQGLKMVARLPRLNVLFLDHTGVTDAGLNYLSSTPALVELSVSNTSVSDEMLDELRKEIPAIQISDD